MKHHSNQPVWTLRPIVALTLGVLSSMAFAAEPEPTGTASLTARNRGARVQLE